MTARPAIPEARTRDIRRDLLLIAEMVAPQSRVLDVGCGDGMLLEYLWREKQVDSRGIEVRQSGVNACVARGLSVIQGDADTDLADYPDAAFDYAILSLTLQATRNPRQVLRELLRIGKHAIVSFPNFAYWRVRLQLLLDGRMPMTAALDDPWYETQNIHLCTIRDFDELCARDGIVVEQRIAVDGHGNRAGWRLSGPAANIFGAQAVYLLRRRAQ
ncbi:methionine biosynthesis protein MetW [Ferrovibrio sp.]|uniref:methionine biosynthesis protein MetW n=1 Tax=Ferrovibrio sp. TaxID=1917215 RepID=UPI0025B8FE7D|nr:methionine biosynthesis protein MetW [Ferrovibrio sp.]